MWEGTGMTGFLERDLVAVGGVSFSGDLLRDIECITEATGGG